MRKILSQPGAILLGLLLLFTTGLLALLGGCGGGTSSSSPPPPPAPKIQHVVVIVQENRSPDNLFQDPVLINNTNSTDGKGADIQSFGFDSKGNKITLTPTSLQTGYDLGHAHSSFVDLYDNGKMDGADLNTVKCNPNSPPSCPPPNPWFQSVNPSEVAPYFQMAETYTFGDRMFQTQQGPSFPAHQFLLSGTSAPSAGSSLFVAENPVQVSDSFSDAGCIAPPAERVNLIDTKGDETQWIYPCFDHPTLTDIFDAAKISWRFYAPSAGIIWNAPTAIEHMCVPNAPPPNGTACTGSEWTNNVVLNSAQVLTDVANGQLPSVSWVIPRGQSSDHPAMNDGTGPSWVASVVNAIGNSQYWSSTAIIITWDDWGGWYDHVPPPAIINAYEYGFRVPLIVVSPFAKAKYISHQVNDFGSILKFIEETFKLSNVAPGASPAYADATSFTGDLSDCFDFSQTPLTFQSIPAEKDARYFLEDKTPATDPDDD
jgi:phospholipase C